MEIKIRSDKKQKAQSFEATLQVFKNGAWGHFDAEFEGYGSDEWSAKQNLFEQIDLLIAKLHSIKQQK